MVLLLDDVIDPLHHLCHRLPLPTPETVTLIPRHYLELVVLELLCEIVKVELELVLHLLTRQVPVGHGQSGVHAGDGQQSGLEITEEHLFLERAFEQELLGGRSLRALTFAG